MDRVTRFALAGADGRKAPADAWGPRTDPAYKIRSGVIWYRYQFVTRKSYSSPALIRNDLQNNDLATARRMIML
jgi:hypothetical protein